MDITKDRVLAVLKKHRAFLSDNYDVKTIAIFGSVSRDDMNKNSDVDILVEYSTSPGMFRFFDLKDYLETIIGCRVDLVTKGALKRQMQDQILSEAIYVA